MHRLREPSLKYAGTESGRRRWQHSRVPCGAAFDSDCDSGGGCTDEAYSGCCVVVAAAVVEESCCTFSQRRAWTFAGSLVGVAPRGGGVTDPNFDLEF